MQAKCQSSRFFFPTSRDYERKVQDSSIELKKCSFPPPDIRDIEHCSSDIDLINDLGGFQSLGLHFDWRDYCSNIVETRLSPTPFSIVPPHSTGTLTPPFFAFSFRIMVERSWYNTEKY